jgi:hypothetical protein
MKQAHKRGQPNEEIRNTVSNEGKQTRRKKMKKFRKIELRKEKCMKRYKNVGEMQEK